MHTDEQSHDLNRQKGALCPCGRYGKHVCNETTCKNCKETYQRGTPGNFVKHRCIVCKQPHTHKFVMSPEQIRGNAKGPAGLFVYDMESRIEMVASTQEVISEFSVVGDKYSTDASIQVATYAQTVGRHVVNLVCYQNVFTGEKGHFFGDGCIVEFLQYLTTYNHGNNVVVAHNAAGYDTRLLFETACKIGAHNVKISPILQGTKFLQLKIGNLVFRDSLLHLKGSLASLAKDFCGAGVGKGHFPHLFNALSNYDYQGPIPNMEYFDLPFIIKDEKSLNEFKEWHAGELASGKVWSFKEELLKYCELDVSILAQIVKGYHHSAKAVAGTSPWHNATAPSFVHETILVQITKELELPDRYEDMDLYKARVEEVATKTGWG